MDRLITIVDNGYNAHKLIERFHEETEEQDENVKAIIKMFEKYKE